MLNLKPFIFEADFLIVIIFGICLSHIQSSNVLYECTFDETDCGIESNGNTEAFHSGPVKLDNSFEITDFSSISKNF